MILPAEIIDHILSFLQNNSAALKACSKSHPLLFQIAERHLYARISLWTNDDDSWDWTFKTSDFIKLLSHSPRVVHYIHNLEILVIGYQPDVMRRLQEISAILPMLLALKTIFLEHYYEYRWNALPESFHLAFLDCLRLPSMVEVWISRVPDFPFVVVLTGGCKTITSLTLRDCLWSCPDQKRYDRLYPNQTSPFQALCLHGCNGMFFDKFIPWVKKRRLQFRSLKLSRLSDSGYIELITTSSNSLTNLDLEIRNCVSGSVVFAMLYTHLTQGVTTQLT